MHGVCRPHTRRVKYSLFILLDLRVDGLVGWSDICFLVIGKAAQMSPGKTELPPELMVAHPVSSFTSSRASLHKRAWSESKQLEPEGQYDMVTVSPGKRKCSRTMTAVIAIPRQGTTAAKGGENSGGEYDEVLPPDMPEAWRKAIGGALNGLNSNVQKLQGEVQQLRSDIGFLMKMVAPHASCWLAPILDAGNLT